MGTEKWEIGNEKRDLQDIWDIWDSMSQASEHLKNCASVSDLKCEIRSLCARFGSILRIDVLLARRGGARQALCFWRMESRELEDEVMSEFGVGRFGGDLVVIVDLEPPGADQSAA